MTIDKKRAMSGTFRHGVYHKPIFDQMVVKKKMSKAFIYISEKDNA